MRCPVTYITTAGAEMGQGVARTRRGFSLVELVIVMLIMGIVAGLAVPKLNLSRYRVDGVALAVRAALQTAQRTAISRQYDVIVSFDTANNRIRIAPDPDNSGTIDGTESTLARWRPLGASEGNLFGLPPRGFSAATVSTPVVGSTLRKVNGWPSITFHRDGSASSDAEVYLLNAARGRPQYRVVTLVRSTGRTDAWRFAGTDAAGHWEVVR